MIENPIICAQYYQSMYNKKARRNGESTKTMLSIVFGAISSTEVSSLTKEKRLMWRFTSLS